MDAKASRRRNGDVDPNVVEVARQVSAARTKRPSGGKMGACPVCGERAMQDPKAENRYWHAKKFAPCLDGAQIGFADGSD
jgi:hypothetical protein